MHHYVRTLPAARLYLKALPLTLPAKAGLRPVSAGPAPAFYNGLRPRPANKAGSRPRPEISVYSSALESTYCTKTGCQMIEEEFSITCKQWVGNKNIDITIKSWLSSRCASIHQRSINHLAGFSVSLHPGILFPIVYPGANFR